MKAKVFVTLKPSVLDPQGKAIHHSAEQLGFQQITDIRQGKYFELALEESVNETEAELPPRRSRPTYSRIRLSKTIGWRSSNEVRCYRFPRIQL